MGEKERDFVREKKREKRVNFLLHLNPTTALTHLKILIYMYGTTAAADAAIGCCLC